MWRSSAPRRVTRHFFSTTRPRRSVMQTTGFTADQLTVREAVSRVCADFPDAYWRDRDQTERDPTEFHAAVASAGWLGIALPEALGGAGLGISEATVMMQTIAESGAGMAGAQAVHANLYATQPLALFGCLSSSSEDQQQQHRATIANILAGKWRVCFAVTEPGAGLDTLRLATRAVPTAAGPDGRPLTYRITGQKVWITCAQVASRMILLARTTPLEQVQKPSEGLSLFCIPMPGKTSTANTDTGNSSTGTDNDSRLTLRKIGKMGARAVDANEVFFDGYEVPASALVGAEGHGFPIILHGLNAERCLLAGEALGLGYAALTRAAAYAASRVVFGRPVGANQGVAHPLADAAARLEAARLATYHAARLYDGEAGRRRHQESSSSSSASLFSRPNDTVGIAANTAKYLAAEAAFHACERAVLAHGGMGYAREYDVERWLRESLVPRIAPVSQEMILNYLSEKVLKLPRSY